MDRPIMLTPQEIVHLILAVCGAIVTISAAITLIMKWVTKAKEPEQIQNTRLSNVERRIDDIDKKLAVDKKRLDHIEYGNEVTQEALLALLDHALNDNEIEGLKAAKKKLETYLISTRKGEDG